MDARKAVEKLRAEIREHERRFADDTPVVSDLYRLFWRRPRTRLQDANLAISGKRPFPLQENIGKLEAQARQDRSLDGMARLQG